MNEVTYTAEEVANILDCDAQTLRGQVKSDIAQGRNKQNWNARQVGNKVVFPKHAFDKEMGIGPVFELGEKIAEWLVAHGWAVSAEVQDGEE